ncbi:hypothetical protein ACFYU8_18670 [Brevibacillus sp. NPDC003359]|uniref:hypothetical protein n=1 Tax=unclassified Brevibacillus TaxID=2684853 RepID=UPI0036BA7CCA
MSKKALKGFFIVFFCLLLSMSVYASFNINAEVSFGTLLGAFILPVLYLSLSRLLDMGE